MKQEANLPVDFTISTPRIVILFQKQTPGLKKEMISGLSVKTCYGPGILTHLSKLRKRGGVCQWISETFKVRECLCLSPFPAVWRTLACWCVKITGVSEQNAKALGHLWATEPIRSVLECPFSTFPFVRPKFITFYYCIRRHNNDLNRQSINDRNRNIQSVPGYKKKMIQRIKNMNSSSPDSSSNHTMNLSFPNSMVKTCLLRYAWNYVHCYVYTAFV